MLVVIFCACRVYSANENQILTADFKQIELRYWSLRCNQYRFQVKKWLKMWTKIFSNLYLIPVSVSRFSFWVFFPARSSSLSLWPISLCSVPVLGVPIDRMSAFTPLRFWWHLEHPWKQVVCFWNIFQSSTHDLKQCLAKCGTCAAVCFPHALYISNTNFQVLVSRQCIVDLDGIGKNKVSGS